MGGRNVLVAESTSCIEWGSFMAVMAKCMRIVVPAVIVVSPESPSGKGRFFFFLLLEPILDPTPAHGDLSDQHKGHT